ncbi:MAG: hypothetical protein H0T76_01330 [Nannocystis sp.]|nr:hypothetical protein [Nannocystis sp.]MBA3545103.1 hypothetical protein [Nannocystis sp.]
MGRLRFEERPFVIMQDDAFVELGSVRGPLKWSVPRHHGPRGYSDLSDVLPVNIESMRSL